MSLKLPRTESIFFLNSRMASASFLIVSAVMRTGSGLAGSSPPPTCLSIASGAEGALSKSFIIILKLVIKSFIFWFKSGSFSFNAAIRIFNFPTVSRNVPFKLSNKVF